MLNDNSIILKKGNGLILESAHCLQIGSFTPHNKRLICKKILFITHILFQVVTVFIVQLNFT